MNAIVITQLRTIALKECGESAQRHAKACAAVRESTPGDSGELIRFAMQCSLELDTAIKRAFYYDATSAQIIEAAPAMLPWLQDEVNRPQGWAWTP